MTKSRDISDSINRIDSSAADATAMTIDSSERVFIGNTNNDTNPASTGSASNKGVTFGGASDPYLSIGRTGNAPIVAGRIDSDGDIIFFYADGTNNGAIGGGSTFLTIGGSSSFLFFEGNVMGPCGSSSGSLKSNQVDLGTSTSTFKDLYLGGGAYLGGTSSAHHLDDYEEGTFTVTLLTTGSPNPTYTITNNTGYYTKVGRLVTANFYSGAINITNAGSGAARISGLPFNANTAAYGQYSVVSFTHTTAFTSNAEGGITLGGSTQIAVYAEGTTSSMAFTTGSSLYMMFTVTYWTD